MGVVISWSEDGAGADMAREMERVRKRKRKIVVDMMFDDGMWERQRGGEAKRPMPPSIYLVFVQY